VSPLFFQIFPHRFFFRYFCCFFYAIMVAPYTMEVILVDTFERKRVVVALDCHRIDFAGD
jgi:hypothetical protein